MGQSHTFNLNQFILKESISLITIVILFFSFLHPLMDGLRSFAQFQDNTYMILPIFSHISKSFSMGEYPYWMNSIMGGIPLYNAAQFSALYPFYFFNFGLFQDPLVSILQVHYITVFHVLLIAINTYILARIIRLNRIASIFAAFIFCLSPNMLSYMPWANMAPYAWFPLAIGAFILILEQSYRKSGIILGVLSISLLVFASVSQVFIQLIYFCLALGLVKLFELLRNQQYEQAKRTFKDILLMSILSFLIVSPVLLPTALNMSDMIRWVGGTSPVIGNGRIPFENFLLGQISIKELANAFMPMKIHYELGHAFVGASVFFLGLTSLFYRKSNPYILIFFALGIFGLISATGQYLGTAYLTYQLPLLNKLREPTRHLTYFVICFSLLAGFGLQYLIDGFKNDNSENKLGILNHKGFILFMTLYTGLIVILFFLLRDASDKHNTYSLISLGLLFILILTYAKITKYKELFLSVICGIIILLNFLQYPWIAPTISEGDYILKDNLDSHEFLSEISKIPDANSYRILFEDKLSSQIWAMNASYYGLRSFNAYFNPLPYQQFTEIYYHGGNVNNYISSLGAKYIFCKDCLKETVSKLTFITSKNGINLYENKNAAPYIFISNKLGRPFNDMNEFYSTINMNTHKVDVLHFQAKFHPFIHDWIGSSSRAPQASVQINKKTSNFINLNTVTTEKSILVLNEYLSPNWKAEINGKKAEIIQVNLNQIGIFLDKGANEITFKYRPTVFFVLLWVSGTTLAFCILYLAYLLIRSLKRKSL